MDRLDAWLSKTFGSKDAKPERTVKVDKGNNSNRNSKKQFTKKNNSNNSNNSNKSRTNSNNNQNSTNSNRSNYKKSSNNRNSNRKNSSHHKSNRSHSQNRGGKKMNLTAPKSSNSTLKPVILKDKLRVIPLGGLNEVGKNMMAFEYEEDIVIIDMGFEFPSDDLLGIDYVIPDVTYLEENKDRIRGVIITHAHLDHIGGIPYILPKLDFPPLFGAKLTLGLVEKRGQEFGHQKKMKLNVVDPEKDVVKLGKFKCSFFRVVHSIPDSMGVVLETPVGKVVHTGDFKFDDSPAGHQKPAEIEKLKKLGEENVLALFSDSTNSMKPGHSMSESQVGDTLKEIIESAKGRLIIASFSSLIGRIQQIIDYARMSNRKVFVSGRSMINNISIARRLGYINHPPGLVEDVKNYKNYPDDKTLILTTGSQGEALSALTRIAFDDHSKISLKKGDTICLSSSPIVGNERAIFTVINQLCLKGVNVIHNQVMDVHTSGHGYREELKMMINYVKPKFFIPVHGEYYMRQEHAKLAVAECGIKEENVVMLQNGDVLYAEKGEKVYKSKENIDTKYVLIDGKGEGHVGSQVLMDREMMSQNGALIILMNINRKSKRLKGRPDVISKGFIYMHETEHVLEEIAKKAGDSYKKIIQKNPGANSRDIKKYVSQSVERWTHKHLQRRPLIVPLLVRI